MYLYTVLEHLLFVHGPALCVRTGRKSKASHRQWHSIQGIENDWSSHVDGFPDAENMALCHYRPHIGIIPLCQKIHCT